MFVKKLKMHISKIKCIKDLSIEIVAEYRKLKEFNSDKSGKSFYALLDTELRNRRTDRNELVEIIIDNLFEEKTNSVQEIVSFLHKELA